MYLKGIIVINLSLEQAIKQTLYSMKNCFFDLRNLIVHHNGLRRQCQDRLVADFVKNLSNYCVYRSKNLFLVRLKDPCLV